MTDQLQKQFRRLAIAGFDLWTATRCLVALQQGGYHARNANPSVDTTFFALNLALVVSYARPFVHSEQGSAAPATTIVPEGVIRGFSPAERLLHDELLRLRSTEFAHSDADAYQVIVSLTDGMMATEVKNTQRPLSLDQLALLSGMLDKLREQVLVRQTAIGEKLGPGTF